MVTAPRSRQLIRRHPGLTVVLALGLALRITVLVTYPGGIVADDSWDYIYTAFRATPVAFSYARPSGYPFFIRMLSEIGSPFWALVIVQHLIVMGVAVAVYQQARKHRVPAWIAVTAAAVILFDARLLALSQSVMSEVLFVGLVTASVILAAKRTTGAAAFAGLLLAFASVTRTSGLFCIPVILLAYLWGRRWKALAAAGVAAVLPLLAYCGLHDARTGQFSLTEMDGWYSYGRVGAIVDCTAAERSGPDGPLCRTLPGVHNPAVWIFLPQSPAWQLLGPPYQASLANRRANSERLESFALRTIREHPLPYARLIGRDLATLTSAAHVNPQFPTVAAQMPDSAAIRVRFVPGFDARVGAAAGFLRAYEHDVRLPQPGYLVLPLFTLIVLVRRRPDGRRLAATAAAVGSVLIVSAAATAGADFRYTIVTLPLMVLGAALGTGRPTQPDAGAETGHETSCASTDRASTAATVAV